MACGDILLTLPSPPAAPSLGAVQFTSTKGGGGGATPFGPDICPGTSFVRRVSIYKDTTNRLVTIGLRCNDAANTYLFQRTEKGSDNDVSLLLYSRLCRCAGASITSRVSEWLPWHTASCKDSPTCIPRSAMLLSSHQTSQDGLDNALNSFFFHKLRTQVCRQGWQFGHSGL